MGTVATAVAVLVSAAVLLLGALAWRLSSGPIELPSLTSRLQTALSSPDGSAAVRIASTAMPKSPPCAAWRTAQSKTPRPANQDAARICSRAWASADAGPAKDRSNRVGHLASVTLTACHRRLAGASPHVVG